ncbi:MAG: hypothetical protein ACI9N3_001811 [Colwellia sp.]
MTFELDDYLQLIALTGHCISADKRGFIEQRQPEILKRLNISVDNWLIITTEFKTQFYGAIGHENVLSDYCEHQQFKRRHNLNHCSKLFA